MSNKYVLSASVALTAFCIFILVRYGHSYNDLAGAAGFADFAFRVVGLRMLAVFLLLLASFGLGGAVFGRLLPKPGPLLEEALFKTALGLIVISYAMFALGLAGLVYPATGYALIAAGMLAGVKDIPEFFGRLSDIPRKITLDLPLLVLSGVSAYFLISGLYNALMPPTGFDVLMYHFGAPKLYIDAHRIYPTPDVNGSTYPFGAEMLYMTAMLVEGPISANLINYSFAVLGGLAAAAFCRRFLEVHSGLMAFALYVSVPVVLWLMPQAYVELSMAFYTMMAAYAVSAWIRDADMRWLYVAALMAGFTMSIKYTGIIVSGLAGAWIFLYALSHKRAGIKNAALRLAAFGAVCLAISLPWYLKNLVYFGNPLYPLLTTAAGNTSTGLYGVGGGFWSGGPFDVAWRFISSLWRTTLAAGSFTAGWSNAIGPCFLMLVPGMFLFIKGSERELRHLVLFGLAFFFAIIPQANLRYIVPALPMLAVAAAYAPGRLLSDGSRAARWAGRALVTVFAFAALMANTTSMSLSGFPSSGPRQVDRYYSQGPWSGYLASYDIWKWIGTNLPKDAMIYQLWDDASVYFRTRKTIGTAQSWGDTGRQKLHVIRGAKGFGGYLPGSEIISNLKAMGAGYLLINANREGHSVPQDPYFTANADLIASHKGVYLYRLK